MVDNFRILHVASFSGNLGDAVSHASFRKWFSSLAKVKIQWVELEMREVYRGHLDLRDQIQHLSRSVDLIIIGGGGYWETWVENTESGTSLDIVPEFLSSITTPIFFNSLGVDVGRGFSRNALKNFPKLLKFLVANDRYLVSVRNDGSLSNIRRMGFSFDQTRILENPDPGFFYVPEAKFQKTPIPRTISVNLAMDMSDKRFRGGATTESFITEMTETLGSVLDTTDYIINFVPHIYSDLSAISAVLSRIKDKHRRERILVAPLATRADSFGLAAASYRMSEISLAMRFHSCALAVAGGTGLIPLVSYPKVQHVANQLENLDGQSVSVSIPGFGDELVNLVEQAWANESENLSSVSRAYRAHLSEAREGNRILVIEWLNRIYGL